ncbi:ras guanine nucleotide exchange factor domain-containing protein [Zychaea mexicana]|uniref:ras guanine nucleotide exchange factor domain-containing protein n=1 Tax=Zychaea mexicana TaxID=64656 RepID=UPI0022FECF0C|nr:ras guanine nucleotide exchange factor domain-containing protein [Zychaea mexicana]KAI9496693.1 ras guanine nucleotide exchange factor domain-containing protein [Zychaea mexicana]
MAQKPAAVIVPKKNKTSTTTSYTYTYTNTNTPIITSTPSDIYVNSTNNSDEDKGDEELKPKPHQLRRPSNASAVALPSSPLVNPISAVKTFLSSSAPSAAVASLGTAALSTSGVYTTSSSSNREDDFILMASGAVDPACLAPVQPSLSDTVTSTNRPSIPQAPLHIIYKSLQQKLENLERHNLHSAEVKQALNRVRHIHMTAHTLTTLLPFAPVLVAYQLTLIDSAIFRNIQPSALLNHHAPKSPHPAITASTDFFNYLTRVIEHAVLTPSEASGRAEQINFWIKVAIKCHDLKNFQTLKAIISALGTPPIQRLKRSWAYVPKKSMARLDVVNEIMTEHNNYERYRDRMARVVQQTFREPVVPFLGVFMHDVTYLTSSSAACNVAKLDDLLTLFTKLHKHPPYSSALPPFCVKDLNKKQRKPFANESLEVQQCLVTQYLLTRSWVSEKTVDELSLLREPPKVMRSCSATDHAITYDGNLWSSSGSFLSFVGGSSSGNNNSGGSIIGGGSTSSASSSRPVSLESDEDDNDSDVDKQNNKFWVFGRKSVDHQHSHHQSKKPVFDSNSNNVPMLPSATNHLRRDRLSRHFSFEDLNTRKHQQQQQQQQQQPTSLSIFRKDFNFWRKEQQDAIEPSSPQHPLDYNPVYKRNSVTLLERPITG